MKKFLLICAACFLCTSAWAQLPAEKQQKLDAFIEKTKKAKEHFVGYPVNQNVDLKSFYEWWVKSDINYMTMNNAGDPFDTSEHITVLAAHEFERDVISFFAPRYGFSKDNFWGIITFSGTDGNNHGLYFGAKYLKSKTKLDPIVYVSQEAHYSIKRLCDLQNLTMRLIPANKMGEMNLDAFEKAIDPSRPALVVIAMGTTFKGAIDDQMAIDKILKKKKPVAVYRHIDAALFGGYLPFTQHKEMLDRNHIPFDSIAVSAHKFFGMDEPAGYFITTQEVFKAQSEFKTNYLNTHMPMINCSRSATAALKFWWLIQSAGEKDYQQQAKTILELTDYLNNQLDAIGYPHWVNTYSNTIFFKRPSQKTIVKWSLASEKDDRFGGDVSHAIVLQHFSKAKIDEFVSDLKRDNQATK